MVDRPVNTREFTKVSAAIWSSPRFRKLDAVAQILCLYFISGPHQNSSGCCAVPDGYAITDLGWSMDAYLAAREVLIADGLIAFDHQTVEVLVERWFRHNPPMNPSHRKAIIAAIERIQSPELRAKAAAGLAEAETTIAAANAARATSGGSRPALSLLETNHMKASRG